MSIKVGSYIIHAPREGKVWIVNTETGDGGSFPVEKFEAVVNKFFGEEF